MQGVRGSSPLSPTISTPSRASHNPRMLTTPGMLTLELNGRSFQAEPGTTLDALFMAQYKEGFKEGIAAKLNGRVVDFHTPIRESGKVEMIGADTPEGLA